MADGAGRTPPGGVRGSPGGYDHARTRDGSGGRSTERGERRLELTISQVAGRLGVSLGTVRRWADHGHLRSYRTPGGQRRFSAEDLEQFVASLERRDGSRR